MKTIRITAIFFSLMGMETNPYKLFATTDQSCNSTDLTAGVTSTPPPGMPAGTWSESCKLASCTASDELTAYCQSREYEGLFCSTTLKLKGSNDVQNCNGVLTQEDSCQWVSANLANCQT